MPGMREYRCEWYRLKAPPTCCLFCDHCTDVLWDYWHGPYMFFCEIDGDTDRGCLGQCDRFAEGTPGEGEEFGIEVEG